MMILRASRGPAHRRRRRHQRRALLPCTNGSIRLHEAVLDRTQFNDTL